MKIMTVDIHAHVMLATPGMGMSAQVRNHFTRDVKKASLLIGRDFQFH